MAIGPPPKEPRSPNELGDVDLSEIDDLFSNAAFEEPTETEPPPEPPPAADEFLDAPEPPATDLAAAPEPPPAPEPPEPPPQDLPWEEPAAAPPTPALDTPPGIFDNKTTFRAEAQR